MRFIVLALCVLGPVAAFGRSRGCEFQVERASSADAVGVEKVVIRAGAGQLKVAGHSDATRLEAHGIVCSLQQGLLGASTLSVHREGNVIFVEARLPENDPSLAKGSIMPPSMNLTISMPKGMAVEADYSGEDATFEDLESLKVEDRSGHLWIRRIAGAIAVNDGRGDIEIENAGSAQVRDSSGAVEVRNVSGSVTIEKGNSGRIHVSNVDGDLTVLGDGPGRIEFESIRGKITLPERGSH